MDEDKFDNWWYFVVFIWKENLYWKFAKSFSYFFRLVEYIYDNIVL